MRADRLPTVPLPRRGWSLLPERVREVEPRLTVPSAVRVLATSMALAVTVVDPLTVSSLNTVVVVPPSVFAAPVRVTAFPPCVKTLSLVQFPPTLTAPPGVKVAAPPTNRSPLAVKTPPLVE